MNLIVRIKQSMQSKWFAVGQSSHSSSQHNVHQRHSVPLLDEVPSPLASSLTAFGLLVQSMHLHGGGLAGSRGTDYSSQFAAEIRKVWTSRDVEKVTASLLRVAVNATLR